MPPPDAANSPFPEKFEALDHPTFNETWAEMEKIYASGKAKAIGVSNFSIKTCVLHRL
jgi:glycerol 2-dehydrogenase (NADP+)